MKTLCLGLVIVSIVFSTQKAAGQHDTLSGKKKAASFWGQAGVQSNYSMSGNAYWLGVNYSYRSNIVGINYYRGSEASLNLFRQLKVNKITSLENITLVYGRSFDLKYLRILPTAGISAGRGYWRNDRVDRTLISGGGWFPSYNYTYHYDKFNYVGFYCGLDLLIMPTRYFGIGATLFRNFHVHPDGGFSVYLVFGKLRSKV